MQKSDTLDPIRELAAAVTLGRQLADQARADLEAATPVLVDALKHGSGTSAATPMNYYGKSSSKAASKRSS